MLPVPNTARRSMRAPAGAYAPLPLSGSVMGVLRQRTRLTNLAVSLLFAILCLSLLTNVQYALAPHIQPSPIDLARKEWDEVVAPEQLDSGRPPSVEATINRDRRMASVNHLVVVPGHAVWTGHDATEAHHDDQWVLETMQRGGSVNTYIQHIETAAEMLVKDPHTLLVFSGGATRPRLTSPLSEGASYHRLAAARNLLPTSPDSSSVLPPSMRATTEEYALDSYENLVFSMARFREVTGRWPDKVTVVGYGMKKSRFEQLHRGAIRFPAARFTYIGIDDEGDTTEHYAGELKHGYAPFLFSPSGCRPPLSFKRADRNPFSRYPPYHASTPELAQLLEWCPPLTPVGDITVPTTLREDESGRGDAMAPPAGFVVFEGSLPWDGLVTFDRERD